MKGKKGVRYINGKKFVMEKPQRYTDKENARYEALEARRDNKFGMGDPFLFRIVKHKDGYYTYLHALPKPKNNIKFKLRSG